MSNIITKFATLVTAHDSRSIPGACAWSAGEPVILKDTTTSSNGEEFYFVSGATSNRVYIVKSSDHWQTYSYVESGSAIAFSSPYVVQDSTGKCHFFDATNGYYQRISLVHTAGAITGFAVDGSALTLPISNLYGNDQTADAVSIITSSGVEYIVLVATFRPNVGNTFVSSVTVFPIGITSAASFTSLSGTANSATILADTNSFNSHSERMRVEQHPISKDLFFVIGAHVAESQSSLSAISYYRFTTSGSTTWSISGSLVSLTMTNGSQGPFVFGICRTANYVWLGYTDPTNGIRFGRFLSDGTWTASTVASPDTRDGLYITGAFRVASDESRIYLACSTGQYGGAPANPPWGTASNVLAYYDGSAWNYYADNAGITDNWGCAGCSNIGSGVSAIISNATQDGIYITSIFDNTSNINNSPIITPFSSNIAFDFGF